MNSASEDEDEEDYAVNHEASVNSDKPIVEIDAIQKPALKEGAVKIDDSHTIINDTSDLMQIDDKELIESIKKKMFVVFVIDFIGL